MLNIDPAELVYARQRELLTEAERDRLIHQLPPHASGVRRTLAVACYRVASWLDAPAGYVQMPDPGPEDWATPWAHV
jgi:hypothetical protein